jgi:signal peptidase I
MMAKKVWKIISNLLTGILFLLLIFMIFVVVSSKASGGEPSFLGYQLKTVLSGSMEPTFKTGSIIAIKPMDDTSSFKKNDIITFMQKNQTIITHRIIKVIKQNDQIMYQTKGDNNKDSDFEPVLAQNVVGKYVGFTIPLLGYLIDFAKSNNGLAILLIVPGVLLLIYSVITVLKVLKELDSQKENPKSA